MLLTKYLYSGPDGSNRIKWTPVSLIKILSLLVHEISSKKHRLDASVGKDTCHKT